MLEDKIQFLNRSDEFSLYDKAVAKGGLHVLFGRRRIGKSHFLRELVKKHKGVYYQAIQASDRIQIQDFWGCINAEMKVDVGDWVSFFQLLTQHLKTQKVSVIVIDEFPFLVESDDSLPSILQKWVDEITINLKSKVCLICAGSSQRMMNATFLNSSAPLYGRAQTIYNMPPLSYSWYLKSHTLRNFQCYSLLGGIPRYWHLSEKRNDPIQLAENLFFKDSAILSDEPSKLLYDEGIYGKQPSMILNLIGRGSAKPSEIAGHLALTQGSLTKPINQLIESHFIEKEFPFAESTDNSKKVLLNIKDPCLKFYYSVVTPNRNRWNFLSKTEKEQRLNMHASHVFEQQIRAHFKGQRYWDKNVVIDLVAPHPKLKNGILVGEVKFKKLTKMEKASLLSDLKLKWQRVELSSRYSNIEFKIFEESDAKIL
jgi:AAA+ ATPase superfamily predicted ATPase